MKISNFLAFVSAIALLGVSSVRADNIGVQTTPNINESYSNGNWVLGYSFTVDSAISVTALGVFGLNNGALNGAHDVGLWDSAQNLLASATVNEGSAGIIQDSYQFTSIAPVLLTVGDTYYVAASWTNADGDTWLQDPTALTVAPEITYDARKYEGYTGTLVFPGLSGSGTTGYFGGNFLFVDGAVTASTPDSATTLGLLAIAVSGMAAVNRRSRRLTVKA
jgi:prepilin-type processing-associated H-X9-DG protein